MTRVFSLTGIGICQNDNVRLIPIKNNIQILLTIKKDFIEISPYRLIYIWNMSLIRQQKYKKIFINLFFFDKLVVLVFLYYIYNMFLVN